jgi:hypothetical protein
MFTTEYYPPEITVYRGGCYVIKIEAKFVPRHSGQRTTREKKDRPGSIWSYTTFSRCARCLPLYLQDTVEACVSVVRFSRVG